MNICSICCLKGEEVYQCNLCYPESTIANTVNNNYMNSNKEELPTLENFQSTVAKKYGLGEKLVTGHAKKHFDEASIEYTKFHVKKALEEAGDAYLQHTNDFPASDICKNIIMSYPESNIK